MFLVTAGAINISSWVETQKQGAVGKMNAEWLLLEIYKMDFSGWGKDSLMVSFNQNLFEFHPCLGPMTRCSTRFLAEVLLSEQFKGDGGRGIKEKG